jgi:serine O-acetyltransferase
MGPNALSFYRAARRLQAAGVPLLPQTLVSLSARLHQVHLDLRAQLGEGVELGYGGVGVVVAPGVTVGHRTFLCQNVTLGERPDAPGVPRVGSHVLVGSGAMVLGPVTVGDHAEIGANAVVTEDVPAGAVVAGVPARILRRKPLPSS